LKYLSRIRSNSRLIAGESQNLLQQFGLWNKRDDLVRTYSSGMKQRLKFVFALLHRPSVLLLDEPTSNLDAEGVEVVRRNVEEQKRSGIVVVATNVDSEALWCSKKIHLGP
ncbi:MAG: ATP-binding cassette domain-containing protein, partial [Bacteroidota bacterium]